MGDEVVAAVGEGVTVSINRRDMSIILSKGDGRRIMSRESGNRRAYQVSMAAAARTFFSELGRHRRYYFEGGPYVTPDGEPAYLLTYTGEYEGSI